MAYSIESKQKLYGLDFPRASTYSFCNDPPLMAVGRYDQKSDFSIRDLSTGRQVCTIPLDAAVTKAAFSPDGSLVYIGLRSKLLRAYRVSDGKPAQEIITQIAPVAIPPTGNRFVGFMFDSTRWYSREHGTGRFRRRPVRWQCLTRPATSITTAILVQMREHLFLDKIETSL